MIDRSQRLHYQAIRDELDRWARAAHSILQSRTEIARASQDAVSELRHQAVGLRIGGRVTCNVIPLRDKDMRHLHAIAHLTQLPTVTDSEANTLRELQRDLPVLIQQTRSAFGLRRLLTGKTKYDSAEESLPYLDHYFQWATGAEVPQLLDRLQVAPTSKTSIPIEDALSDQVGLRAQISDLGGYQQLIPTATLGQLKSSCLIIGKLLNSEQQLRAQCSSASIRVRAREVQKVLSAMPVDRLKDTTQNRLRLGPLTDAGIRSVQNVIEWGPRLEALPGVGATTAARLRAAAQTLWQVTLDETPVRFDANHPTAEATTLLKTLYLWGRGRTIRRSLEASLSREFSPLLPHLDTASHILLACQSPQMANDFLNAARIVVDGTRKLTELANAARPDPWTDFLQRPADYYAMLAELGLTSEDKSKTQGDLPNDIVEAVRGFELDTRHLTVSLRGYQNFGAKFALVQRKAIIGDDMGLGKTVEALAVMAHLRSLGLAHFFVVCPATVLTNWMREVGSKSTLVPYEIHGNDRWATLSEWMNEGGVAITTFETLRSLDLDDLASSGLDCVVVDEAHFIKNPDAQRSQNVNRLLRSSRYSVLLTGTPLENNTQEFGNLVAYLRPDLVVDTSDFAPRRFRKQVAPAYLRRNQEDVLTELPELIEIDEIVPMTRDDMHIYQRAVADGNFMAIRQAAMLSGAKSEKMQRLLEIIEEASKNNRRTVVFSYFLDVLAQVSQVLHQQTHLQVFGPLTGSVPANQRQLIIDNFSAAPGDSVLISQIMAGGVGLNIQAASIVIICEPQLKPTTEWQAVARTHRMGQLESVQVHRLLNDQGVDPHITAILARKQLIFEDFARVSDTAKSAPEAIDISEVELAREVVAAERERLFRMNDAGSSN